MQLFMGGAYTMAQHAGLNTKLYEYKVLGRAKHTTEAWGHGKIEQMYIKRKCEHST